MHLQKKDTITSNNFDLNLISGNKVNEVNQKLLKRNCDNFETYCCRILSLVPFFSSDALYKWVFKVVSFCGVSKKSNATHNWRELNIKINKFYKHFTNLEFSSFVLSQVIHKKNLTLIMINICVPSHT